MSNQSIESVLNEKRVFEPDRTFSSKANITPETFRELLAQAKTDPQQFWTDQAKKLHWFKPWSKTLEWNVPFAKWFVGGKTNISYNCLDRIVNEGQGEKIAVIWEGEPGETKKISYKQLLGSVCQAANALLELGVRAGDRVVIYLPMIPEAIVSMLACARIGAVHSVIFGGFSAEAIRDRVNDASAKIIITADGGFRRGKVVALKANVDTALRAGMPSVEKILVVKRTGEKVEWNNACDVSWETLVLKQSDKLPAAELDSEAPLFILYTSGTTGKPKGIVHTSAGYMVQTNFSTAAVFDLKPNDIYWCTADVGWITGHSYIVYGPLSNGTTVLMYEGSPDFPDKDRFWATIAKHKVTIFYTAPTAIRTFMKWGPEFVQKHDLSSLRLLGTVGEPINPEAWIWYRRVIGRDALPIVDTWWQTETGSIMISPLPGVTATKPGSATLPLPGVDVAVVDEYGVECAPDVGGLLVIRSPWPSMLRDIFNDSNRYKEQYWSRFKNWYFTGDGARRDKDGYFWIMGRVDDVLNVAGHRLGTAEVESALVAHPEVAEAAVVGAPDELKGEAVVAFVTLKAGFEAHPGTGEALKEHVVKMIGAIARPREIVVTPGLPKTRSGKIMRRLLRNIASGKTEVGDTTTLEDVTILGAIKEQMLAESAEE